MHSNRSRIVSSVSVIVSAYQKQGDKAPPQEITRAESLRMECMKRIAR